MSCARSASDRPLEVWETEANQPFQEVPDRWNARVDAFCQDVEARLAAPPARGRFPRGVPLSASDGVMVTPPLTDRTTSTTQRDVTHDHPLLGRS